MLMGGHRLDPDRLTDPLAGPVGALAPLILPLNGHFLPRPLRPLPRFCGVLVAERVL